MINIIIIIININIIIIIIVTTFWIIAPTIILQRTNSIMDIWSVYIYIDGEKQSFFSYQHVLQHIG